VLHLICVYVTMVFIHLSAVDLDFISAGVFIDEDNMLHLIERIWQTKVLSQ